MAEEKKKGEAVNQVERMMRRQDWDDEVGKEVLLEEVELLLLLQVSSLSPLVLLTNKRLSMSNHHQAAAVVTASSLYRVLDGGACLQV